MRKPTPDDQKRVAEELKNVEPVGLRIKGLSKSFLTRTRGKTEALSGVDLEIKDGEYVCLVGQSGCGKTTLLNLIAGLDKPDKGSILVNNVEVAEPGRDRMVMFQESALFPWLDVMGNILFGLNLKPNLTRSDRLEVTHFYLKLVGLEAFAHANIHELSGGMKQRVALARALAPNPRVLLMDEPFGALDALTREQLYSDMQKIWLKRRKTVVFVTHNVREAVCLGDRVVLMAPSPGRIVEDFPIDLERPRDINSSALSDYARRITLALKGYGGNQEVNE